MPENVEAVERWLGKLESGLYPQTVGKLHRVVRDTDKSGDKAPVGFCCLGLACETAIEMGVNLKVDSAHPSDGGEAIVAYDGSISLLPRAVMDFFGFTSDDGQINGNRYSANGSLAGLNDQGRTFKEIASIVRDPEHRDFLFGDAIWKLPRGAVYHKNENCSRMSTLYSSPLRIAKSAMTPNMRPCKVCFKDA